MKSLRNSVQLIGRLGKDPEVKEFGDKKKVSFSIATSESYKNQKGEKVEDTEGKEIVDEISLSENEEEERYDEDGNMVSEKMDGNTTCNNFAFSVQQHFSHFKNPYNLEWESVTVDTLAQSQHRKGQIQLVINQAKKDGNSKILNDATRYLDKVVEPALKFVEQQIKVYERIIKNEKADGESN